MKAHGTTAVVEVTPLPMGRLAAPAAYVYRRGSGPARLAAVLRDRDRVELACTSYLLRHPSAGPVLVDTGLHPDALVDLRRDFGTAMGLMFRGLRPEPPDFASGLRDHGIDPGGVELVVMTHLHVDHTSGMRLLDGARFVCSKEEWAAATRRGAGARGYVGHHLPPPDRMALIDFETDAEPHGPFAATLDLLGDGSIRLVSTPGHTPGHLSVLAETPGGPMLLAGDAVYTTRNLAEGRLPALTADDDRYRASLAELQAFAARPGAVVVASHDPDPPRRAGMSETAARVR